MEALLEACVVTSNGLLFGRHLGFYHELENQKFSVICVRIEHCKMHGKIEIRTFLGGEGRWGLSHTNETNLCTRRLKKKRKKKHNHGVSA